jgi:DNA polymerase III alpha subunit (gram-positive type)
MSAVLLGFDIESTGVVDAYPVQAGLVWRSKGTTRVLFNSLIRNRKPIEKEAAAVHGITEEQVRNMPDDQVAMWMVKVLIESFAVHPSYLVTFNGYNFDIPIFAKCLGLVEPVALPQIDVLRFARHYFPEVRGAEGGKTLGELYQVFLAKPLVSAHDAATDVIATLDLLEAMRIRAGVTLEQLANEQRQPKPYVIMPLGKYTGVPVDEVPKSWASYMSMKSDLDADLRATVNLILSR